MQNKSILLVDDEAIVRKAIAEDLRSGNYDVSTAESGEEAVAILKRGAFDLVVTDLMMDGMDGIQVLKKVKEIDHDIAVVILTGYGDMTSAIDAVRFEANDYLCKPCDSKELLNRINTCLEKQELQKKINLYEDILPICSFCKKIRNDAGKEHGTGEWVPVEQYFTQKTNVRMSHSICDECLEKYYPDKL